MQMQMQLQHTHATLHCPNPSIRGRTTMASTPRPNSRGHGMDCLPLPDGERWTVLGGIGSRFDPQTPRRGGVGFPEWLAPSIAARLGPELTHEGNPSLGRLLRYRPSVGPQSVACRTPSAPASGPPSLPSASRFPPPATLYCLVTVCRVWSI